MLVLAGLGCNKNRNTWFNRNYQNMVARYNVYYNGEVKLQEAIDNLALNHKDNYNEILDVFPYGDDQQAKAQASAMDEVIKKGSKIILDRPLSKWVDDAYMLVGKAYFFKAEYYPAIETFQYINTRYKNTPIAQEATIWILKSYLMLKRYDDAEALVGLLRNEKNFRPDLVGMFSAATGGVYIKQKKYGPALETITTALAKTKKRSQKARYCYIKAQLLEKMGQPDSAKLYLEKVLRLNPSYEMAFNTKISLARNYDPADKTQVRKARRYLRGMLRDDKNISYFDQIYYQLGLIEMREGNRPEAVKNFGFSLQTSQSNQNQKALSYLALADLYFEQPEYVLAQKYYDSTVKVIQPDFSDYKVIVKKQSVLSELIKYKVIVAREDSLQFLAKLDPRDLDKRVDRWIKEEEQRKKNEEEERQKQKANPDGGGLPGFPGNPGGSGFGQPQTAGSGSSWYFYSQPQISTGYNDFIKRWGNRKLTDDWRWSQKDKTSSADPNQSTNPNDPKDPKDDNKDQEKEDKLLEARLSNIPEEKRKYYRDIPFSDDDIKRSDEKIASALYYIGSIYYEKLGDIPEAIKAFDELLTRFPGNEAEPRVYYYLHKIYKTSNPEKANQYKNLLISKYPASDFALLVNDNLGQQKEIKIPQAKVDFYNATYGLYTNNRYAEVKSRKPAADTMLGGTLLMPQYMLLYAMSVGKTEPLENYKTQLKYILEQYPATEISQRAQELLDAVSRKEQGDTLKGSGQRDTREDNFAFTPDASHFVGIIFPSEKANANDLRIKISDFNRDNAPGQTFEIIPSSLSPSLQLVLIRTFEGKDKAQDYKKIMESFHTLLLGGLARSETEYFVITGANYAELIKQKEFSPYKSFYNRYYGK